MVVVQGGGNHGQSMEQPFELMRAGLLKRLLGARGAAQSTGQVNATAGRACAERLDRDAGTDAREFAARLPRELRVCLRF